MIQIYCGEGKGKTSAAAGAAIRAAGQGLQVYFIQFMKGNESGEITILEKLEGITVKRLRKEYPFYKDMNAQEREAITKEHNELLNGLMEIDDDENTMMILDELTYPVKYHLINEEAVRRFLKEKRKTELIITGRDPWEEVLNMASCITECKKIRHHFDQGIPARRGIEY